MASPASDLTLRRPRSGRLLLGVVLLVGALALAAWHASHPAPLPTSDRTISASTPVGEPVYVGMANGVDGRTLHLSGVQVHTTSDAALSVTPLLCRDGRIEATTQPEAYCSDLLDPEGEHLGAGDSVIVRILGDSAAVATIDPVRIGFREQRQWGTYPTGARAVVRVLPR